MQEFGLNYLAHRVCFLLCLTLAWVKVMLSFHNTFLRQGGIPIKLIRRIMLPGDDGPTVNLRSIR